MGAHDGLCLDSRDVPLRRGFTAAALKGGRVAAFHTLSVGAARCQFRQSPVRCLRSLVAWSVATRFSMPTLAAATPLTRDAQEACFDVDSSSTSARARSRSLRLCVCEVRDRAAKASSGVQWWVAIRMPSAMSITLRDSSASCI